MKTLMQVVFYQHLKGIRYGNPKKTKLLHQMRIAIRTLNYALSIEKTYVH